MSDLLISIIFSLIAAFAWGLNSHVVRKGMQNNHPMLAMVMRALGAFPILILISIIISGITSITVYFKDDILVLVLLTSVLIVLGDGAFLYALKYYPVKIMTPIASIYPLITTFILIITGTEEINSTIIIGTILIIIGVVIVTNGARNDNSDDKTDFNIKIILLGFFAAISWGTSIFFVRIILEFEGTDSIGLTGIRTLFMGLIGLIYAISNKNVRQLYIQQDRESKKKTAKLMFISGVIGWVIGASSFFYAIQKIGAAIPTPITSTNPIISVVFGKFFGIEDINKQQFLGIVFSVIGTITIVIQ